MTDSSVVMTPTERALWKQARDDYKHAKAIALEAWGGGPAQSDDYPPEVLQAATATVLIHIQKMRELALKHGSSHRGTAPHAALTAVKRDGPSPATSQASAAVPPCKKCGGAMDDVRGSKRNEKSPDFVCRQEKGDCGKPSKDKTKWFPTASWLEKPTNGANSQPNALAGRTDRESFDAPPPGLEDDEDSGLPF